MAITDCYVREFEPGLIERVVRTNVNPRPDGHEGINYSPNIYEYRSQRTRELLNKKVSGIAVGRWWEDSQGNRLDWCDEPYYPKLASLAKEIEEGIYTLVEAE